MNNKKEKRNKLIISAGIIAGVVALFLVIYFALEKITGGAVSVDASSTDQFAKCLSEKNVKMYGAYWCPHCVNNKGMFGNGGKILVDLEIYVECDAGGENPQPGVCSEKRIGGYPTWEINNKLYSGEMSMDKIAELSGCALE